MNFVYQTLAINILCNVFTFIFSCVVLYTNVFKNRRIQKQAYKPDILWQRLPLILFNLVALTLLTAVGLYMGQGFFVKENPSVLTFVMQLGLILICDDFYFYWYHRLLHQNKYLLAKIHSIHHRASTPFPMEYIYVHPLEWLGGYVGPFIAILLLQEVNVYVFWTYLIFRNLHEADIHSDIRSIVFTKLPLIAPTEHHDLHHSRPYGNYSSTFNIWDKVFKTEMKTDAPKP